MDLPTPTLGQLVTAGCHFGHSTRRWDPKMAPFLYGTRSGTHIIDLRQTLPLLVRAMQKARAVAAKGGGILFVGTKRQAQDLVAEAAQRCGQYYVNHRWLGGMLTNWKTISHSIRRLRELEELLGSDKINAYGKREQLGLTRSRDKLERALGGIKDMQGVPGLLFVIDASRESLAIAEAVKLGVPVAAVVDSNGSPDGIDFPIPGNDDAIRAIKTYCDLIAGAILSGIQAEMAAAGLDVGADENVPQLTMAEEEMIGAESSTPSAQEVPKEDVRKATNGEAVAVPTTAGEL